LRRLTIGGEKQVEWHDCDKIDPEPKAEVRFGDLTAVLDDFVLVIHDGRVEEQNDVNKKQGVDHPVDNGPSES